MSRTRKDRPYRVKVNDPAEPQRARHRHQAFGRAGTNFRGDKYAYQDRCTAEDTVSHPSNRDRLAMLPCERDLAWQYRYSRGPGSDHITEFYWAPARQEERIVLYKLAGEYNTLGDLVTEPVLHEQHRHAGFSGGWWD